MLQNEKQRGPAATGSRLADWRNAVQFNWGASIAFIAATVSPSPPFNKVSVSVASRWPASTNWDVLESHCYSWQERLKMDGFSISAPTRAAPSSDRRSDTEPMCRRRRSHLHLQHRHMTAAIKPHQEISVFRFHKATPRQPTSWSSLDGWAERGRKKTVANVPTAEGRAITRKKEKKKEIKPHVSVTWPGRPILMNWVTLHLTYQLAAD